jgi:hypothetical protein
MYITLTNEKEQIVTVMLHAILHFEDYTHADYPDIEGKIFLRDSFLFTQENSEDIRGKIDVATSE